MTDVAPSDPTLDVAGTIDDQEDEASAFPLALQLKLTVNRLAKLSGVNSYEKESRRDGSRGEQAS